MKEHSCIVSADLHGNKGHYQKLREAVYKHDASCVFLCGDLLPKDGGLWSPENKIRTIGAQKEFIKSFFNDFLDDLSKKAHIYIIYGNDDFKSTYSEINLGNENVTFLDKEVVPFFDTSMDIKIAGYPYVPLTPFMQKDWEKWDEIRGSMNDRVYREDGFVSHEDTHMPVDFSTESSGGTTIAEDMEEFANKNNVSNTIYLMHAPPYDTCLDQVADSNPFLENNNVHVGSSAIRNFVQNYQPLLTLHGHIHETFEESGEYVWRCKNSTSATPAHDFKEQEFAYLEFSIEDVSKVKRFIS